MGLLVLQSVTKRYTSPRSERVALRRVSLEVDAGELVAVWGLRRSGKTTLLRVAAGVEPADEGVVCFDGKDLAHDRDGLLGDQIGYCNVSFPAAQGGTVIDHAAVGLLAKGMPRGRARARAEEALRRVGASSCADLDPRLLDPAELTKVAIARALASEPRLLLLDEPTQTVDLVHRDAMLRLIRSLADEGIAILMTVSEAVTVADRVLTIDDGELHGDAIVTPAPVVPLRPTRSDRTA